MTFSQPTRTSVATTAVVVPRSRNGTKPDCGTPSSWHRCDWRAHPALSPRAAPLRASCATELVDGSLTRGVAGVTSRVRAGQANRDAVAHGTLCGLQHAYDLESALAVSERSQAGLHAVQEVLVLDAQRLVHLQVGRDDVAVPVGHRDCGEVSAIGHGGDSLVVHLDALLGLEVVEDDHLVAADHRDLDEPSSGSASSRGRWRTPRGPRSTASAARRPRAVGVRCALPSTPPSTGSTPST